MKLLAQQIIDQVILKQALLENYPQPGVTFLTLDTLFNDPISRKLISQAIIASLNPDNFEGITGIASRGLIFSGIISHQFAGKEEHFIQKVKIKNDPRFVQLNMQTEYSSDALQLLKGTITPGKRYLLTDDLIATGGSVLTAIELIRKCGGIVDTVFVMTELEDLGAKGLLEKAGVKLISILPLTKNDLLKLLLIQKCYNNDSSAVASYQLTHFVKNAKSLIKANQSNQLNAHLASTSIIKTKAAELACQGLFDPLTTKMTTHQTLSGVNDQPWGEEETAKGATNRLKSLQKTMIADNTALLIAMENGLRYSENDKCYYDFVHVIVKRGEQMQTITQDCCQVPIAIINAIPKDAQGHFLKTWGQVAHEMGLAKDANNPHQEELFGKISRKDHLFNALCKALMPIKQQLVSNSLSEIEAETVNIKRLLDLDSKKSKDLLSKRRVVLTPLLIEPNSKPIDIYNHGIPKALWNIDAKIIARNSFKIFPTGDAFPVISAEIEIAGEDINLHVGTEDEKYSPLTLIQEALQLCRCVYEHGAKSITIALPEAFHPILHYSDFNSLLTKLFKASGANKIYFYDKNYRGILDSNLVQTSIPLTLTDKEDASTYHINRDNLLCYLHDYNHAPNSLDKLKTDYQVMHYTRQYHFNRLWSKLSINKTDSHAYLGGSETPAELVIPQKESLAHIVFSCSANKPLAEEIAAQLTEQGEKIALHSIQGKGKAATIADDIEIAGKVVTIVQSTRPNPNDLEAIKHYKQNGASDYFFEAAIIARLARLRGASTIHFINPYQFSARSDKAENNPYGKTGAYVQQMGMLLEAAGVNHVVTAECHDNHTMSGSYTGKKIKGFAVQALSIISANIANQWIEEAMPGQLRLVNPDVGAAKRTKELTQQLKAIMGKKLCQTRILGEKQRDSHQDDSALITAMNTGDVKINPNDKYLITDDETTTGTTLCQAIINIKKNGAQYIDVIIIHNNMPLDWMERQLCLARFLYLGANNLHFSNTQEMGTLAKNYEDLIHTQATIANVLLDKIEKEIFDWFKKNLDSQLPDNTPKGSDEAFTKFKSSFKQLQTKIQIHSLAADFAKQVLTKPVFTQAHNPLLFFSQSSQKAKALTYESVAEVQDSKKSVSLAL